MRNHLFFRADVLLGVHRRQLVGGFEETLLIEIIRPLQVNGAGNRANIASGNLKASGFDKAAFQIVNTNLATNTYLNKSLFSDPAPLTLGNSAFRLTQIRNFGVISEDIGLQKNQTFKEKYRFQLRAEFLNAFNRHQLGGINTTITNPAFGQVTSVSGFRVVQVGTRFDF